MSSPTLTIDLAFRALPYVLPLLFEEQPRSIPSYKETGMP